MLRVKLSRLAVLSALAILSCSAAGFNPETGSYVFQQYSAQDYGASPQNWSIAQDKRGVMYFANTDGLLEFDGTSWRVTRLAGKSLVYSVATDNQGTVYVGGVGDFGVLRPGGSGVMGFVSLKNLLPAGDREFLQVWRILPTVEGVYFSSAQRLFRLNPDGSIKVWRPKEKFTRAFLALGTVYVQARGEGLLRLRKNRLEPVAGGERFKGEAVNDAVPFEDGYLIATNTSLYRLTGEGVGQPLHTVDTELATGTMYAMAKLPGGETAIGTRKIGLVLLNAHGAADRVLSSDSDGLASDYVSAIFADHQGGIWLTGQNGITRFIPSMSFFDKSVGIEGDVITMARQGTAMYAGTSKGVFRMASDGAGKPRFERVEGINYLTNALTPFDGGLVAATDRGVFFIAGHQARPIFEIHKVIWDICISLQDRNTAWVAARTGVIKLRRQGTVWTKAAELQMPSEEFRTVLEDADGRVWATTQKNIWRIDFSSDPVKWEKFDSAQGVPAGWINARRLGGHIVFATTKGLKQYSETLHRFVPDASLGSQFSDGSRDVFNIFEDKVGNVWVTGEKYHGLLAKEAQGYRWKPMPLLQSGIDEIYWMSSDDDGTVWATGAKYVLHRWDPALAGNPDRDFHVIARRVLASNNKDEVLYGGAGTFNSVHLPWRDNALRFEFAAPFYEDPAAVEYQVRLEGSDRDWSAWSHDTKKDYTHLPEGNYRLRLRARSPHGAVSEDASLSFGVTPPWYRTWWAYTFYALCAAFSISGLVRVRTRQLEADKKRLEIIVDQRTIEIRAEERKSHNLLLNILPAAVAGELKSTGAVKPVAFDDVTVCFTDFVGFTLSSEKMPAGKLVDALNEYFTRFDEIVARYGLEKLKTIGDSYMFVSGLPTPRDSHAVDGVLAAIEMVQVVKELGAKPDGTGWNIRVGLHSGPVVAGVVGIRKFAFDIWGNTVNFAARMESSGVPGSVNMSERTCRLTRGLIDCEGRGHVKIKEGRELPMFLARQPVANFAARYKGEFGAEPPAMPTFAQEVHALTAS